MNTRSYFEITLKRSALDWRQLPPEIGRSAATPMRVEERAGGRAGGAADGGDRPPHMQELQQQQQQRLWDVSSPALCPGETWPASECGNWRTPLIFRPQRFSIEELHERESRAPPNTSWRLQYFFARSETLVLKRLLEDHGFIAAASMSAANIIWCGGHVKPEVLLSLTPLQKVNHYPRTVELTRKDMLVRTITALRDRCGAAAFEYLPVTFVLPAEADALATAMSRNRSAAWIVKPVSSSRGRGISLVSHPHQLPSCHEDVVVSRYMRGRCLQNITHKHGPRTVSCSRDSALSVNPNSRQRAWARYLRKKTMKRCHGARTLLPCSTNCARYISPNSQRAGTGFFRKKSLTVTPYRILASLHSLALPTGFPAPF